MKPQITSAAWLPMTLLAKLQRSCGMKPQITEVRQEITMAAGLASKELRHEAADHRERGDQD